MNIQTDGQTDGIHKELREICASNYNCPGLSVIKSNIDNQMSVFRVPVVYIIFPRTLKWLQLEFSWKMVALKTV